MANSRFFSLMVVGDDPEEIVEKYSSSHKTDPYVKYKYLDAKKYQKAAIKSLEKILSESDKIGISDNLVEQLRERLKVLNSMSSFDYYRELTDGLYYNEDGDALTDENPNYKFDTCRKGGNFSLPLILKDGTEAYQAYSCDIDWEKMKEGNSELYKTAWELVMEGREPTTEDEKTIYESMKDKETYFEKFGSKEEYVLRSSAYWNYAFTDRGGGWRCVDDKGNEVEWIKNFYKYFVEGLDGDDLVTIYECSVKES